MKIIEGNLVAKDLKIGIVAGRFNEFIVSKLLGGALDGLKRHGVDEENIDVAWVPGAFELPLIAKKMVNTEKYDADYVCAEVSKGIASVSLQTDKPVIFGVLTTNTIEQAIERAGTKAGNKGYDAAVTAIEMANLLNCF